MERYKMVNGAFVPPPAGGVTVNGRAVSNFAGRVRRDASFAAANGYYPIAAGALEEPELLEEESLQELTFTLKGGMWVRE